MSDSFIPTQEANALIWMQTYASGLTANPGLYQLSAADALAIQTAVNSFAAAYTTAIVPATRTPVTVNAKDNARNSAEQICRQYAILIKFNAGITDADKIAIGVRPVNPSRDPINVPDSSPLLNILGATPGSQTVRYADTSTPDSGKKPFGASNIQIFVAVGTAAIDDPESAQFYGAFTKNPVAIAYDPADDGKIATCFGRWASRTGETGPWSLPVSMRIAA